MGLRRGWAGPGGAFPASEIAKRKCSDPTQRSIAVVDFEREAIGLDDVLIDGGARGGVEGLDEDAAASPQDAAMASADPP